MRNLRGFLDNTLKVGSAAATIITLATARKILNDEKLTKRIENTESMNRVLAREMKDKAEQIGDLATIKEENFEGYEGRIRQSLDGIDLEKAKIDEIHSRMEALKNQEDFKGKTEKIAELITDAKHDCDNVLREVEGNYNSLKKLNEELSGVLDEIIKKGVSGGGGGVSKFLSDYWVALEKSVEDLSTDHLIAVGHISASVFVLLCLFSIVSVHYGDLLIKYFKLEDKFPRLAKYIRLRRLFQEYYFIFNVLLIVLILLYIIYMNCSMLLLR